MSILSPRSVPSWYPLTFPLFWTPPWLVNTSWLTAAGVHDTGVCNSSWELITEQNWVHRFKTTEDILDYLQCKWNGMLQEKCILTVKWAYFFLWLLETYIPPLPFMYMCVCNHKCVRLNMECIIKLVRQKTNKQTNKNPKQQHHVEWMQDEINKQDGWDRKECFKKLLQCVQMHT